MKLFGDIQKVTVAFALAFCFRAMAGDATNAAAPVTARDFYNAGTKLLAAKKFPDAERMFQSSLAAQDEPQPPHLAP